MNAFKLLLGILGCCFAACCSADEWPQWMGPRRDNVWRETGVITRFPEGGPKVVWRTAVAGGYAGPAVVGDSLYMMDYISDKKEKTDNFERETYSGVERVLCLNSETGKLKWKHEYPVKYTISYPAGPRSTPVVEGGKVYALGAEGNLWCLDAGSGEVVWSKDFHQDYGTKTALWGYASHPLIVDDMLISVVGGEGSQAVAFDKNSGKEKWRALSAPEQGYSPPTLIEAGGARQLLFVRPTALSSVDPATGHEHWSVPYDTTNGLVVMSPIQWGDYLYVGGFSNKSLLVKLAADKPAAEIVWRDKPAIAAINVQPTTKDNVLYGVDQKGVLRAVELPDGKKLWETPKPMGERPANSGTAFIIPHGDDYWMFVETGDLVIAKLSPQGFEEIDRAHVIEPTNQAFGRNVVWCMPAFAHKRAFIRNDKECICVDLAAK
jgi:outer membrane protein assembly factor BamB